MKILNFMNQSGINNKKYAFRRQAVYKNSNLKKAAGGEDMAEAGFQEANQLQKTSMNLSGPTQQSDMKNILFESDTELMFNYSDPDRQKRIQTLRQTVRNTLDDADNKALLSETADIILKQLLKND